MDWSNMTALFADDIIAGTDTIANVPPLILDSVTAKVEAATTDAQAKVATGDIGVAVKTTNTDPGVAIKTQVPSDAPHVDATADPTPAG